MNRELFAIANQLENALRNSNEFIHLLRKYEEVNANPAAKNLFNTFNQLQMNLYQKQMSGQEVTQQEVDTLQNLTARIQQDEKVSGLMEANFHLNTLMMELNKMILKPVEELYAHSQGGATESIHPGQNIRYY
ncbi:YlbF family regulator [Bacillus sp. FJAT-27251]|uniref:YlbF family regulator n=1 Tax=Bacillus sp. FJAT-27251 TaxID=1684142 RepID=UPI0006A763FA|nr:YlbF family regulator [Bacillus sp. FJAT-27251]